MARALRSESYRLVRRWMPWVIVGLTVLLVAIAYEGIWLTASSTLQQLRSGVVPPGRTAAPIDVQIRALEEAVAQLRPARILETGGAVLAALAPVVAVVFVASHVGTEYAWGTLRTLLASGLGRTAQLASKLVTALVVTAVFVAAGLLAAVAASYAVSTQAGLDTAGLDLAGLSAFGGRLLYTTFPYMALAALIAVWSRSAGAAIAAGLVLFFLEGAVGATLVNLSRDWGVIANYGLSRNVAPILRAGTAIPLSTPPGALAPLDAAQGALVLGLWTAFFLALAFWRVRSRDVTLS